MIRITQLKRSQLHEFVHSKEYAANKFVPISPHRALSHIKNPRASDHDPLLFLAYEQDQLVGYLGTLPDLIFIGKEPEKCAWLSCLWVDPEHRGKRIAQQLVEKSFVEWKDRILLTGFTHAAKKLYDKMERFDSLEKKVGIRLYVRSCLHILLPPKGSFFKRVKLLLKVFDLVFNFLFDLRFLFISKELKGIKLDYTDQIDRETEILITSQQGKQLFKRGTSELNWMLEYPWILSSSKPSEISRKYHFSSTDRLFQFVPVKVRGKNDELIAFILFARRNHHLKLPYFYIKNDLALSAVVKVINFHLVKWKIETLTIFHEKLVTELKQSRTPALYKKSFEKEYLISSVINSRLPDSGYEIQDGDADYCFT